MKDILKELDELMREINYGVPNEQNENLLDLMDEDEAFNKYYRLQTPEELLQSKLAVCWDQVELEREFLTKKKIDTKTFFICTYDNDNIPSHTFITFKDGEKIYWYEHSWFENKSTHEYNTLKELLKDVKQKFIESHETNLDAPTLIYEYTTPPIHLNCEEFYKFAETGKLMKVNEPLYFYHLVPKNTELNPGILSLQYMYDNKMYDLFDKYTEKYKTRIVNTWNIEKYKGRKEETLTRKEIIDALKIFRGEYGASYIYFFKFPPKSSLGPKMKEILNYKDIYRININDEEIILKMKDIFYGFKNSNSDEEILTKSYYENITEEEYFNNYDDTLEMNYSTLSHISIAFESDYCPSSFIEKV